jgi:hypothetical protein
MDTLYRYLMIIVACIKNRKSNHQSQNILPPET